MADTTRRTRAYQTYGNVAYQPQFDGNAVRAPRRQELERPAPPQHRPRVQPRRQPQQRPRVEVREAGAVAPFAVVGFLTVALCAVLLVVSYAQLAVLNDQTVQKRAQVAELTALRSELMAEYELAYDLTAIENQLIAEGAMVKVAPSQITYLDISAPDNMIVYSNENQGLAGIWNRITGLFDQLAS